MTAMDSNLCNMELERILEQSLECANRLEDLLHDERSALELHDAGKLRAVTTSKELCVHYLETLESERLSLCAAAGYDAGDAGMEDLLGWCDRHSVVSAVWSKLLRCARQCEALNRTNGAISRVRHEHVLGALAVLNGGYGDTTLYGPEGQESSPFGQRALALI